MHLSLVTAPTTEPIDVEAAKLHVKIDENDDSSLIYALISAAREHVENKTGRKMISQTWDLMLDGFPCGPIVLPFPPVTSITSVSYVDTAGATQTWASGATGYTTRLPVGPQAGPALIYPSYGIQYPSTRSQIDAVTVRFVCGYADAASVPSSLQAAMKLLIGHWYLHREAVDTGINTVTSVLPFGIDALVMPYWARA